MDRSQQSRRRAMTITALSGLGGAAATGLLMAGLAMADQDASNGSPTADEAVTEEELWSGQTSPWSSQDDDDSESDPPTSGGDSGTQRGPGSGSGSSGTTGGS